MNSPLQLNNEIFTEVSIITVPNPDQDSRLHTVVEYNVTSQNTDKTQWMVVVRVKMGPASEKKIPYSGTVECVGFFTVAKEWDESKTEQLVAVNGTSVVYTAIREMVCNITARGPHPRLMLPSQSFLKSYEERSANVVS